MSLEKEMAPAGGPANAVAAASHHNPYPLYAALRAERPLYWDASLKLWVASSHAAVSEALLSRALHVRPAAEPVPAALLGTVAGEIFSNFVRMRDGPFHEEQKPAVTSAVSRFSLQQVAEASRYAINDLHATVNANSLLISLPVHVMATMLGVARAQLAEVTHDVHQFVRCIAAGASPEGIAAGVQAAQRLVDRCKHDADLPAIARRISLIQQSVDATAGLLGNTVIRLQDSPDLQVKVLSSKHDAARVVGEVARWDASVQNTRRFASDDLMLQGHEVKRGEGVLLLLASANRDPLFNADPDTFNPDRRDGRNLTFGDADHACPAQAIATDIVAEAIRFICAQPDILHHYFGSHVGYLPLPNARIPVFKILKESTHGVSDF